MQYIQLQGQVGSTLDTPLEGGFNLFIDTNDGTIKAKDSEGNLTSAGGGGIVDTTYNQLTASLNSGSLTAGTYYKITDFKTCYDQPDYNVFGSPITIGNYRTGSISPIIVFALDSGSLASDAYQPEYPKDNIKYDISFNETEVTNNPAFGRITYRKDNQGNEMDYDFREVRFKRYDAYFSEGVYDGTISVVETGSSAFITGSGSFFENFTTGDIVGVLNIGNNPIVEYYEITSIEDDYLMFITGSRYTFPSETRLLDANLLEEMSWKKNNIISNSGSVELLTFGDIEECFSNTITTTTAYAQWEEYDFLLANNVFKGSNTYRDNSFGHGFRNNTFNTSCDSNRIGGDFYNNIINGDFDNNIVNDNFYGNIMDCDFQRNTINGQFYNNHFGDEDSGEDFDFNLIHGNFYGNFYIGANDFEYNTIKGDFYGNIILNGFSKNTLNGFYDNVLDGSFEDNQIGEDFYGNKTYTVFRDNKISDNFYNNNMFSYFTNNVTGETVYNNNFYSYTEYNEIGYNFQNNNIGNPDVYGDYDFVRNKIDNSFYDNTIKQNFTDNQIGNSSYENYFRLGVNRNTIGNGFQNNIVSQSFYDNQIGYNSYGNTFHSEASDNTIGSNFYENTIGVLDEESYFQYNHIGYEFKANLILGDFLKNRIADFFSANEIGYNFEKNTIGEQFNSNNIGDDFEDNAIGNYFEINNISSSFKNNKIGHGFNNNIIGDGFGFGGNDYRGNVIGNGFVDNIIGEYFYDNNIGDRFTNNIMGNGFQYNRIETQVTGSDFTTYLGNINIVSSSITDGTDGVYPNLTGSTAGFGSGSVFEVTVASSLVSNIGITNSGKLYEVNDTITIASGSFGGTTDLVLTVTELQSAPMVYGTYNKTIQRRFDGTIVLTALDDSNQFYISQQITEPID
jgi:hypothetical protein